MIVTTVSSEQEDNDEWEEHGWENSQRMRGKIMCPK